MTYPRLPWATLQFVTLDPLPGAKEAAAQLSATCLRDFSTPDGAGEGGKTMKFNVSRDEWPVPSLIRYGLLLIGLRDLGQREKTAFIIPFGFRGRSCAVSLEKFGMRLYVSHHDQDEADRRVAIKAHQEIIDKLRAAVWVIESKILKPFSKEQVGAGNVTIVNQHLKLRRSYEYFREGARLAFAGEGRHPKTGPFEGVYLAPGQTEGFYNLVATLNAYLSLLEHTLVLSLPFIGFTPETESLTDFIGSRWGDKYRRVFGKKDREANKHRNALVQLTETWRNTYSHGGFDKQHSTIYFHTPGVGAIPAAFSDVRDSPHFQFVPAQQSDFDEAIRNLDRIDEWLHSGPLGAAMAWIDAGLDVRFDKDFRDDVARARDAGKLDELIDYHAYLWERSANMDW